MAVYVVAGRRGELSGAASILSHLRAQWLPVAVAAEAASIVAFAGMQQVLLAGGRLYLGLGPLTGITLAGNSINNSLPGGPAFASIFAYRQYRRRGADEALAAWTIVATGVCAALSLAALAVVGLLAAGNKASTLNLTDITLAVLGGSLVVSLLVWRTHRLATLTGWAVHLIQRCHRRRGRPGGNSVGRETGGGASDPSGAASGPANRGEASGGAVAGQAAGGSGRVGAAAMLAKLARRLTEVRPGKRQVAGALGWALANWVLDCACLVTAYFAVGSPVPWRGLLLAYGAGQLAANLPITPGGLGVVEGSLTIALVAYGGAQESTVAAVLLYRIISFWASLPVGWVSWAVLAVRTRARLGSGEDDGPGGAAQPEAVTA